MLLTAPDRPHVKQGDILTYLDLTAKAREAIGTRKQYEVADDLGVTPPAISLAINKSGARYVELQRRIIKHYTGFEIEKAPVYRVTGKA